MKRRGFLVVSGAATAGAGLLVGTGAFSRVEAQRDIRIEIASDEDAYLRLLYPEDVFVEDCGAIIELVLVGNQLKHDVDIEEIDVRVDNEEFCILDVSHPDSIEVGQEVSIEVAVACTSAEPITREVTFDIEVGEEHGGVIVQDRSIEVTCECPEETAWALLRENGEPDPEAHRINELEHLSTNRWGWYMPYVVGSGPANAELWAAAGNNDLGNGVHVADVGITDDGEALTVSIDPLGDHTISGSSLHVVGSKDELVHQRGHMDYNETSSEYDPGPMTYTIPLYNIPAEDEDEIYLALQGKSGVDASC